MIAMVGKNQIAKFSYFLFAGMGLIFLFIGLHEGFDKFVHSKSEIITIGTVVDVSFSKDNQGRPQSQPVVEFNDQKGRTIKFISNISTSPSVYSSGETVAVRYNPEHPEEASINDALHNWMFFSIFSLFGILFFIIGMSLIIKDKRRNELIKRLLRSGLRIQADISSVHLNTKLKINGESPWVIVAQWLDPSTNLLHIFTSDNIWYNPTPFLKSKTIEVIIDHKDKNKNYVNLDFLPKTA
jgi:hypothetical protein